MEPAIFARSARNRRWNNMPVPFDMVKADLVARTCAATGLNRNDARVAVESVFHAVADAVVQGDRVVIRRFGTFLATPRKTGMARNPRTGASVPIPPGWVARFRPGSLLKAIPSSSPDARE